MTSVSPATNVSGRAPYLRTLVSSRAEACVKLPVICAGPAIGSLIAGAL